MTKIYFFYFSLFWIFQHQISFVMHPHIIKHIDGRLTKQIEESYSLESF